MGLHTFTLSTHRRSEMLEITQKVRGVVRASGVQEGTVVVYVPHTTAGITINENADPDVVHDTLEQLDRMVPWGQPFYRHGEGNSAAHLKSEMMGSSVTVLIQGGEMVLGTWQGVWFCEFDGPRERRVHVKVMEG